MGKYSVLFVQDAAVASGLKETVQWEGLGFSVIGTVFSTASALKMIQSARPDVVLTEVRVADVDGLDLVRRGKAISPETEFVILTDCADFECAQAALRLGVTDYLSLPADAGEVHRAFARLCQRLNQRRNTAQNWRAMQQYYRDSLPLMQANFYAALVDGQVERQTLEAYLHDYQVALSGPYYVCLVLHTSAAQVPARMDGLALQAQVDKQAGDFFGALYSLVTFTYLRNNVMVIQLPDEAESAAVTDNADRFCKLVKNQLGAVITIGVGAVIDDLLELPRAYQGARTAVSYRSLYGASKVINIREIAPTEITDFTPLSDAALSQLFKVVHAGSDEAIAAAVDEYLENINQTATCMAHHTVIINDLISALFRFAVNNHLHLPELTDNVKELYAGLPELSPQTLREWLLDLCTTLNRRLAAARDNSSTMLIQSAKDFVRAHFSDEQLSLNDVCHALGVSNSYFSTLFKREVGQSFITYLTDFRMDRAARLLLETTEKSQAIGHQVGYADPNYFSSVFKKHFGSSPTQYRSGLAQVSGSKS
ncbi:helix-turn-helix domain-containing protein [Lacticaseibacillus jixianensis]|uniref:Helix-turn-helix domain-containing protein n=1 Tax=Lacticaseibacillus jixianensis TaxID=2486012 RepID=A0ABW4BAQ7_9LACO|nr:helix-turn-helix domain-containing protein [Lacticaseibacillus jixianensis]